MTFLNWTMLFGLSAVAIPIVIHLLNRRRAKALEWGAMQFLVSSLASRNRRILIEETVLMVMRCLLVALVVLAAARPFLPVGGGISWALVAPAVLAGAICAAMAGAMWRTRRARWYLLGAAIGLAGLAIGAASLQHVLQSRRWTASGSGRDIVIVIDGSDSMELTGPQASGVSNFQLALDDARAAVAACSPGDAVGLVLAGPVPQRVIPSPTFDHDDVLEAVSRLKLTGGAMAALEALHAAATCLEAGQNPAKTIVFITDAQSIGWDLDNDARWASLVATARGLPSRPEIICRTLRPPEEFRNAAVEAIELSRSVIGTDREVGIDVTIANACGDPIRPDAIELEIDGSCVARQSLDSIGIGAAETVHFDYRFETPGCRVVSARLVGADDLARDDVAHRAVRVIDTLDVLVVDGAPSGRALEGAASLLEIALAPGPAEQCLISPTVVPATEIESVKSFDRYGLVILADVARLPKAAAEALEQYVAGGGGLLIAPGDHAVASFYNNWITASGRPLCPAALDRRSHTAQEPARLAPETFNHVALELLSPRGRSDARSALVGAYWQLRANDSDNATSVAGMLATNCPLLVERRLGEGRVLLLAVALDRKDSNLPSLKCFVPLVHELAYYLAGPGLTAINVKPGRDVLIELPPPDEGSAAKPVAPPKGPWSLDVTGPSRTEYLASARLSNGTLQLSCAGTDEPGLYRMHLPPELCKGYLPPGEQSVPFAVLRDPAESRLRLLSAGDFARLEQAVGLKRVTSGEQLTSALKGNVPGQEIWKALALGALMIALAEIVLARWIAVQRKTHDIRTVPFGRSEADIDSYSDKARRILAVGRAPRPRRVSIR